MTSEEDKKKYLEERRNKKRKVDKSGDLNAIEPQWERNPNSSLFNASFADGSVKCHALADQGADVCVLPPDVFNKLKSQTDVEEEILKETLYYTLADSEAPPLPCSKKVKASITLSVRHACSMVLRKVTWMVSDRPMRHVIIGRNVLRLLGLDNRTLLAAACDRLDGEIDVEGAQEKEQDGEICSLMYKRGDRQTYHSSGEPDDDSVPDWLNVI